jgi:hypothetical protein
MEPGPFNIYRIQVPADFGRLTTRELARLSHEAEDTENDILLLQVDGEMQRRERAIPGVLAMYKAHYMDLIRERYTARKETTNER